MSITRKINTLGNYLTEIKILEEKAAALKAELIESGVTEQVTARFKLRVFTQERGYLDKQAVVEKLGLAWVSQHTNISVSTVVKVTPVLQDAKVAA